MVHTTAVEIMPTAPAIRWIPGERIRIKIIMGLNIAEQRFLRFEINLEVYTLGLLRSVEIERNFVYEIHRYGDVEPAEVNYLP